ncbi:hypothetical protein MLD38_033378 [Melastoma candidum]|uniref:Uncharacterized protein n=1 Tax=Melastoma candidum TaxID=119954 RepID=A0ACB9M974_9MYRT|nr:hypothetical protein MLD38_033378 [Melastoma candidum]
MKKVAQAAVVDRTIGLDSSQNQVEEAGLEDRRSMADGEKVIGLGPVETKLMGTKLQRREELEEGGAKRELVATDDTPPHPTAGGEVVMGIGERV